MLYECQKCHKKVRATAKVAKKRGNVCRPCIVEEAQRMKQAARAAERARR